MSPKHAIALLAGATLLTGCPEESLYEGAFDMPIVSAVVQPEIGGPFEEPIGYIGDGIGGQIHLLSLKQGRFLVDDPQASFARSAPLATGGARLLASIATWAPDESTIHVFAGDLAFDQLVRVPHVVAVEDGVPVEAEVTVGEPVFVDLDGSGDAPTLADLDVTPGFTTTETFTISFDGERWWVTGSRSGRQEDPAQTGVRYVADEGRLAFTIQGEATVGDRFEVSTDSGLVEIEVGGTPLALAMRPDQSLLAMIVQDRELAAPVLRWLDPVSGALVDGPALDPAATPERLAWSADGETVFVSDLTAALDGTGAAWEVRLETGEVIAHAMPFPTLDIAPLLTTSGERLLYVAQYGGQEVWLYDLDAAEFIDVNAWTPGLQGMDLHDAISGLEAIPLPWQWAETDDDGVNLRGNGVAASVESGRVVVLEEGTGCLLRDEFGPRTDFGISQRGVDYQINFTLGITAPFLEENVEDSRHAQLNPCAGIARRERWTFTYSRNLQGYVVEGSLSGVQETLAREDERYVSDDGSISVLIRSGSLPTEDTVQFAIDVLPGVLEASGDNDRDGNRELAFDLPADPTYFHYTSGPTDGGWDVVTDNPYVLVPASASDLVGRVDPATGAVEVGWQ